MQKIINNNTVFCELHYSTLNKQLKISFTKLSPSQATFLKSNEAITKYVKQGNVQQNKLTIQRKQISSFNAYDSCQSQMINDYQKQREKQQMLAKTAKKIKKSHYQFDMQKQEKDKQLQNQVKIIELMADTIYLKAADIMNGRNSSNYTRKLVQVEQIPLKQLKNNTCDKSLKKIEATKKTMITKSQKLISQMTYKAQKQIQLSLLSDSQSNYSNDSLLATSLVSSEKVKNNQKDKNQALLKKLIKSVSFQQVYDMRRRNAAAEGFGKCWKLGNQDKKVQKVKLFQQIKKVTHMNIIKKKQEQKISCLQRICEAEKYQLAMRKILSKAFKNVVENFSINDKV